MLISYLKMTFSRILRSYVIQQWKEKIKIVSLFHLIFRTDKTKLLGTVGSLEWACEIDHSNKLGNPEKS